MTDTLSKIEKRTAYTLLLPAVFLVFAIVLFPIFANIWISFKEVQLKDIRIPEPRAKKIVKTISEDNTKLKIVYRLRNSSLIENIDNIKFLDKLPTNIEPIDLDSRCTFRSKKIQCDFGNWEAKYRENFEIVVQNVNKVKIDKNSIKSQKPKLSGDAEKYNVDMFVTSGGVLNFVEFLQEAKEIIVKIVHTTLAQVTVGKWSNYAHEVTT